jgi:hypothetical protein
MRQRLAFDINCPIATSAGPVIRIALWAPYSDSPQHLPRGRLATAAVTAIAKHPRLPAQPERPARTALIDFLAENIAAQALLAL